MYAAGLNCGVMFRTFDTCPKATGIPKRWHAGCASNGLEIKGSRSTDWSALASKLSKLSSDSQTADDRAGEGKPCNQKQPVLAQPDLGRFQGSQPIKSKMTQSAQLAPGITDENQGAIPNDLKKCRNVP